MDVLDNKEKQVFKNFGLSKFDVMENLLSESKAKYFFYLLMYTASAQPFATCPRFLYDIKKETIFVYFPTETHEAMTKIFQSAFDEAMKDQDGDEPLPWESGTAKKIHIINEEEVIAKLIPDYTIYKPANEAIVVVETSHSQTREQVHEKAKQWRKQPTVVAVIIVHILEQPKFQTKTTPPSTSPLMKHWKEVRVVTPMGPFRVHEHVWVGQHKVSIEILERGENVLEVVRATMFHYPEQTKFILNNRIYFKMILRV